MLTNQTRGGRSQFCGWLHPAILCGSLFFALGACSETTTQGNGTGGKQAGGTSTSSGGTTSQGGNTALDGTPVPSGGTTAASGGTTSSTGGLTAASGGTNSATDGATPVMGGTTTATGDSGTGGAGSGGTTGNTDPPVGNELWIAPTGIDTNPGTKESPMQNLSEAVKKMCGTSCSGKEGFTIWVKGGEYKPEKLLFISASFNGVAGKLNKVWAAPGEKPVFDCSASECVKDNGSTGQPCFFSHCLRVHGFPTSSPTMLFNACQIFHSGICRMLLLGGGGSIHAVDVV